MTETTETTNDERNWYEFNDPFPNPECPCGDPQPDTERLYCEDCLEQKREDVAREFEEINQTQGET